MTDEPTPSQPEIIEAHLLLLLGGYDNRDVVDALSRFVSLNYPFLKLVRVNDLNLIASQIYDTNNQVNYIVQCLMDNSGSFGSSMFDRLHAIKNAAERASACANNALTELSLIPTRRVS